MSQCVLSTAIAKLGDKLILCSHGSTQYQDQEHVLLKNLQLSMSSRERTPLSRITVDDGKSKRFFCLVDYAYSIVYFCLCNRGVGSSKIIFAYLDNIMKKFSSMFAVHNLSEVSTPFKYIHFDTYIAESVTALEKAIQGNNQSQTFTSGNQVEEIGLQLNEVQDIIRTNLEDLVMRGQKLETMQKYSAELREESARFRKKTVFLNKSSMKRYIALIVAIVFFIMYFLWRKDS